MIAAGFSTIKNPLLLLYWIAIFTMAIVFYPTQLLYDRYQDTIDRILMVPGIVLMHSILFIGRVENTLNRLRTSTR